MLSKYDLPEGTTFLVSLKALLRNKAGKYLIMKSKYAGDTQQIHLGLPGGLLERGESLEEGLRREVFEETGLQIDIKKPITNSMFTRNLEVADGRVLEATIVNLVYECETESSEVILSTEHFAFEWLTEDEICKLDSTDNTNLEKIIRYFNELGYPKPANAN